MAKIAKKKIAKKKTSTRGSKAVKKTAKTPKRGSRKSIKARKTTRSNKVTKPTRGASKKHAAAKTVRSKQSVSKRVSGTAKRSRSPKPASSKPLPTTTTTKAKPGRRPRRLGTADLDFFRRLLLEKRAELAGDVNTLRDEALRRSRQDATGDLSTMPIHMADLGTDNYELELTLGLIEGERMLLGEINDALARIRDGTYGLCLATGKPIGKARLKAKPWARYCYEYTLAQEKGPARKV